MPSMRSAASAALGRANATASANRAADVNPCSMIRFSLHASPPRSLGGPARGTVEAGAYRSAALEASVAEAELEVRGVLALEGIQREARVHDDRPERAQPAASDARTVAKVGTEGLILGERVARVEEQDAG